MNNGLFSPHVAQGQGQAQMPQAGQQAQMPPQMPPQLPQEMGTQEGAPKYSVGDPTLDRYINLFLV